MLFSPGARVGPYEIVAALGSGGMGEVYRARDERLGREVALKVLPREHAADADRRQRFEREARAVAALDHPHILTLHDLDPDHDPPYVVFELVGGQTLRQKLGHGPLPPRKAIEYAVQVCRGLAAAHMRGIVHRDLKPENLALSSNGHIKILDFGLARLTEGLADTGQATGSTATEPGTALGTLGYISPEQLRGRPVDVRSDLFSLGAVLYEMVAGRRPFEGATAADRISAILSSDPPELGSANEVPPLLPPIVRRCLEKDPDDRFQSARDLAFALERLADPSHPAPAAVKHRTRWMAWLLSASLALAGLSLFALWHTSRRPTPLLSFKQLSFRRGMILDARFTADGHTVVYGGLFDGAPAETYSIHLSRPESLRLDLPTARLFGVSALGELALVLGRPDERKFGFFGTLARVPLSGGAPREIVDDVYGADWSPDGRELAVLRGTGGADQLEYPVGRVLQRPAFPSNAGFALRVSPDGTRVAYTSPAEVIVIDRAGRSSTLRAEPDPTGLAWDPSGRAVWVGLSPGGQHSTGLWRLGLDGSVREAARLPGIAMIHDVSRDGRMLVHVGFEREGVRVLGPGEASERDVCPQSWCEGPELSPDGATVFMRDWTDRGPGGDGWVFMRSTRGGPAVRLGEGARWAWGRTGARS